MKSVIAILLAVLVSFAMTKPAAKSSPNLDYDEYGTTGDFVVYDIDEDFEVYQVPQQYEIVRETDIEIDYTAEAERNRTSKTEIKAK